jgi:uncharacterized membrane protein YqjE
MNENRSSENHGRTLADIMAEIKDEVRDFVQTRVDLFKAELQETLSAWKAAAPLMAFSLLLLLTGYLLLTLALVGLVAVAFWGSPYAWPLAFLIVGLLWCIGGAIVAFLAKNRLRGSRTFPKKTIEVLKADKIWLQSEAGNQI